MSITKSMVKASVLDINTGTNDSKYITPKGLQLSKYSTYGANEIGVAGEAGFGVGICPPLLLPAGMTPMAGYTDKASDNYGNYIYSDGSVMVWIPRFYFKIEHNGTTEINKVTIKGIDTYPTEANANADGFALHRMFIDGGDIKDGVFIDKYKWSLTGFVHGSAGIASSIKNSNPISSSVSTNRDASNNFAGSFSDCLSNSQTPTDTYGGAWSVAKTRGANFAVMSIWISNGLALLSLAHGQASSSTINCAWYHATYNFPKGNNRSGVLNDIDDATCTFSVCDDAYWATRTEAAKNGSGSAFAKTTHNGQNCGVADVNGNQWEIVQGLTTHSSASKNLTVISREAEAVFEVADITGITDAMLIQIQGANTGAGWNSAIQYKFYRVSDISGNTFKLKANGAYLNTSALAGDYNTADGNFTVVYGIKFFLVKESVAIKDVTGGNTLTASDHFNTTFINANFDEITVPFGEGNYVFRYGNSTNQVVPFSATRTADAYKLSCAGLVKDKDAVSTGGTNQFGVDYYYQWYLNELCPLRFGNWGSHTNAGVWYINLSSNRTYGNTNVSARSCLYV